MYCVCKRRGSATNQILRKIVWGTGITLGMAFNPPIDPNDPNDPGEMIEAAEHKVDSVSHTSYGCMGVWEK